MKLDCGCTSGHRCSEARSLLDAGDQTGFANHRFPVGVPEPLFPDQRDAIIDANTWPELATLVLVGCGLCSKLVANVSLPCMRDPDAPGFVFGSASGSLVLGTRRMPSPQAELTLAMNQGTIYRLAGVDGAPAPTGKRPHKVREDLLQDRWFALLDQVTTAALPAWCTRHGDRSIDVAALRRLADAACSDGKPRKTQAGAEVR